MNLFSITTEYAIRVELFHDGSRLDFYLSSLTDCTAKRLRDDFTENFNGNVKISTFQKVKNDWYEITPRKVEL